MQIDADELLHELDLIDATMDAATRRAGGGCDPEFERRLDTHARRLRVLLDADGVAVAQDTIDAARRVMEAADPAAPLLMLDMGRQTLAAMIRRQAVRASPRAA